MCLPGGIVVFRGSVSAPGRARLAGNDRWPWQCSAQVGEQVRIVGDAHQAFVARPVRSVRWRIGHHVHGLSALGFHRIYVPETLLPAAGAWKPASRLLYGFCRRGPERPADRNFCQIKWPTSRFLWSRSATLAELETQQLHSEHDLSKKSLSPPHEFHALPAAIAPHFGPYPGVSLGRVAPRVR